MLLPSSWLLPAFLTKYLTTGKLSRPHSVSLGSPHPGLKACSGGCLFYQLIISRIICFGIFDFFFRAWALEVPVLCGTWMFVHLAETHWTHFPPLNVPESYFLYLYYPVFPLESLSLQFGKESPEPQRECQVPCAKWDMQVSRNPPTIHGMEKGRLVLRRSSGRLSAFLLLVLQTRRGWAKCI